MPFLTQLHHWRLTQFGKKEISSPFIIFIQQVAVNVFLFIPKDTFQIFETKLTLKLLAYQAQLSAELLQS